MTVFARSDVVSVSLSTIHGGCGQTHTRPVKDGSPVKNWALDCPRCEDHLRHDPLWSPNASKLPETHDEKTQREAVESRTSTETANTTAAALEQLAKLGDLPQVMGEFLKFMTHKADEVARPAPAPKPEAKEPEELPRARVPRPPAAAAKKSSE